MGLLSGGYDYGTDYYVIYYYYDDDDEVGRDKPATVGNNGRHEEIPKSVVKSPQSALPPLKLASNAEPKAAPKPIPKPVPKAVPKAKPPTKAKPPPSHGHRRRLGPALDYGSEDGDGYVLSS